MANAGRILIMPKGAYDSSKTYEMLDMVFHNGTTWLAKKTVTGIEPSEASAEYWHMLLGYDFAAMENKLAQKHNENILINGDFGVWQRGTTFDGTLDEKYTADRWIRRDKTLTVVKTTKGVKIYPNQSAAYQGFHQSIDGFKKLAGKVVTVSCKVASCSGSWNFGIASADSGAHVFSNGLGNIVINKAGTYKATFTIPTDIDSHKYLNVGFISTTVTTSDYLELEWVKMEMGAEATIFSPRPHQMEVLMCEKFYMDKRILVCRTGSAGGGKYNFQGQFNAMRDVPNVVVHEFKVVNASGELTVLNSATNNAISKDSCLFTVELPNGVATNAASAMAMAKLDAEIR